MSHEVTTNPWLASPSGGEKSSARWFELGLSPSEWDLLFLSTAFKLLLFPAYRSTDFEVHRNWLAITYSLPITQWYYDTTSEWTLDYPPFFAYFEKVLSIAASYVDSRIVDLQYLNYDAWSVVAYQRTTVILTELVLGAALLRFVRGVSDPPIQRVISASLFLHPGFVIVDHIHFQYNGFMFGILVWSLLMARDGRKLASGVLFAILLNFKHIYMYLAPAYFIYLLRSFCLSPQGHPMAQNFLSLANAVICIFAVSLGPFALMDQLPQLLSRLFPFKRGLNHAYWAPNAWALLTAADRILLRFAKNARINVAINASGVDSTSRGLVGDTVFTVLPTIKPIHTFVITIGLQAIFLVKLWRTPTYKSFVTALTLCGFSSFMFGWHVHEKAILLVLVPLSLLAAEGDAYLRTFVLASVSGIFSLFPLLFTPAESFLKVVLSLVWTVLVFEPLHRRAYQYPHNLPLVIIAMLEKIYLWGFGLLQVFVTMFPLVARRRPRVCDYKEASDCTSGIFEGAASMEFLPLMVTSVYCAVGLLWAMLRLSTIYLWRA